MDADSSLLNELIQCSEVGGMGAEARKARHKAHRSSRAPRLRGSAGHRLDAVGTWCDWLVGTAEAANCVGETEGAGGIPFCEKC